MPMPKEGAAAPSFALEDQDGNKVSLKDLKGQWVVLYFYPKDDTPGCTKEACAFRDLNAEIQRAGAAVVGVSTDEMTSHQQFREKYQLNFPLLSDTTADVAKMFGAWKEKNLYGRRSWGVARKTVWIGPDGRIRKVYNKVDPTVHGEEILKDLTQAQARS